MSTKSIEIKGIARSLTKLGVQDGQSEDIVNLRFKDGSWRVADDGKLIVNSAGQPFSVYPYTNLYVHTNVYHHLLGVKNGKLWWFANIDANNETFSFVTDEYGDPEPIEICDVQGDVSIVQNGHLLTILNGDKINFSIFVESKDGYKTINANANGSTSDRELFPYSRVHLNLDCDYNPDRDFVDEDTASGVIVMDESDINYQDSGALVPKSDEAKTKIAAQVWHASMLRAFDKAQEANSFTRPFLAVVAVRLYDGSYAFVSNPILLNPREKYSLYKQYYDASSQTDKSAADADYLFYQRQGVTIGSVLDGNFYKGNIGDKLYVSKGGAVTEMNGTPYLPNYYSGARKIEYYVQNGSSPSDEYTYLSSTVIGSQLLLTLGDISNILNNEDVFTGVSIFITQEVNLYNMAADGYKNGEVKCFNDNKTNNSGTNFYTTRVGNVMYKPELRSDADVEYDLMHSPFFLLREYSINELKSMSNTTIAVDLSDRKYDGILKNIVLQKTLPSEAVDRRSFNPSVIYNYNNRLHIANYKSEQFHGFPIDFFQLSNHNLKIKQNSYAVGGVLPNVEEGLDFQFKRNKFYFASNNLQSSQGYIDTSIENGTYFAQVEVEIDSQQGEQKVVRYIKPFDTSMGNNGFVEDLGSILSYPDSRAKKMVVSIIYLNDDQTVRITKDYFELKPHPYLNIAYYINSELKPIDINHWNSKDIHINDFEDQGTNYDYKPSIENNATESFPNGIKVSLTNNPFTFPYETTYQIGSAEIVAIMSNAVAVGTGQTGAAPLYVFCKDGVYALMVDSSGEMAYTNARIIARDVCNNAKSVTPIDNGVIFTTDRGIMNISGNEVVEIGQIAEGDVFDITDTNDKSKRIMFNAFTMSQLADLPSTMLDQTDFLSYINGAIVNYNHNERELMVSNPDKNYSYAMDRTGNWTRRDYSAVEYVNNYPTSYRVEESGSIYKVDKDDNDASQFYLLSNVIKLDTIAFKKIDRLVVRGYFESDKTIGLYVFGSYDGRQWSLVGGNEKSGSFTDIGSKIAHTGIKFIKICLAGTISHHSRIDFVEVEYDGSALNSKLR